MAGSLFAKPAQDLAEERIAALEIDSKCPFTACKLGNSLPSLPYLAHPCARPLFRLFPLRLEAPTFGAPHPLIKILNRFLWF
jgi:hypothetical protein